MQVGEVEDVWRSEEGDVCARFKVRLDTLPGRTVARFVQSGAKGAVSLRHDIVPTGKAVVTPEGHVLRLGKQIRELSVCAQPRREGAVILASEFKTSSPTGAYNIGGRNGMSSPSLVSSAASLIFDDTGGMSESTTAAPAATEAAAPMQVDAAPAAAAPATEAPAAAAPATEVTPPPSRPTRADGGFDMRFAVNKAESQEAPKDHQAEPAAPAVPETQDPMISAMAQAMVSLKQTWGTEMSDMKSQLQQLTAIQLANEQRRQAEIDAAEAAEKQRQEAEKQRQEAAAAEEAKKKAIAQSAEEARLGNLYREYIDSSMTADESMQYMKGLRAAGDNIFNRQAQLLESKASAKTAQAAQWLSYMQSGYGSTRTNVAAAAPVAVVQSAASRAQPGEPAGKRRAVTPAPAAAPVVDIPIVGSDSLGAPAVEEAPKITHINDVFRANPTMGFQEGQQLAMKLLNQDYIVRSQASLQVEAPSGSREEVQLREMNPLLVPDIMEFSPEFKNLWDECERNERVRGGRGMRTNSVALVPVKQ